MTRCDRCGHDIAAHADRAFIACISDDKNPTRCWCPGYTSPHIWKTK